MLTSGSPCTPASRAALAYPSAPTSTRSCNETAGGRRRRASSERGLCSAATRRAEGPSGPGGSAPRGGARAAVTRAAFGVPRCPARDSLDRAWLRSCGRSGGGPGEAPPPRAVPPAPAKVHLLGGPRPKTKANGTLDAPGSALRHAGFALLPSIFWDRESRGPGSWPCPS